MNPLAIAEQAVTEAEVGLRMDNARAELMTALRAADKAGRLDLHRYLCAAIAQLDDARSALTREEA